MQELRMAEPFSSSMVEFTGQRLGGGTETQVGQMAADLLIDGGLAHHWPSAISS